MNVILRHVLLLFAFGGGILSGPYSAGVQHPRAGQIAGGPRERSLCSFHVDGSTPCSEVIARLGSARNAKVSGLGDRRDCAGCGHVLYDWRIGQAVVTVGCEFTTKGEQRVDGKVFLVRVLGDRSARNDLATGAGLRLGDSLSTVRRMYGPHYHLDRARLAATLFIQWEDGPRLQLELDRMDRVVGILLTSEVE
jgi:hypothetical protein